AQARKRVGDRNARKEEEERREPAVEEAVQCVLPERRLLEDLDEVVPAKRMRPKRGRKRLPVRHEGGQDDEDERGEEDDPGRDEQAVIGDGDGEAATSNTRRRRPANKR